MTATAALRIRLLGELDLRLDGRPLPPLESARAESLLAYLLLHREAPQSRQRLAFLLWPDSTEPQARTNLRHVLHNLRQALPDLDRFLQVTPRTLRWRPEGPSWLDVAAFRDALARAAGAADGGVAALREAVELYRATCWKAARTSGSWTSATSSAAAGCRPWSGWRGCWPGAATTPRRSPGPSSWCAPTPCTSRPTGP